MYEICRYAIFLLILIPPFWRYQSNKRVYYVWVYFMLSVKSMVNIDLRYLICALEAEIKSTQSKLRGFIQVI